MASKRSQTSPPSTQGTLFNLETLAPSYVPQRPEAAPVASTEEKPVAKAVTAKKRSYQKRGRPASTVVRGRNTLLAGPPEKLSALGKELADFREFGTATIFRQLEFDSPVTGKKHVVPIFVNEFWTSKQRDAHSLHEVSYRACFKPQLPHFFIQRLTRPGDVVYDPFMGRGTTPIEAAFMGRVPWGADANPLSLALVPCRVKPPTPAEFKERLADLDLSRVDSEPWEELLVFYHADTLREITALKDYFLRRTAEGTLDAADEFIRMVSINRLTGHSPGFFSVYSLPPNQAVSIASQKRINVKRNQVPEKRNVKAIIQKKGLQLLQDLTGDERNTMCLVQSGSVFIQGFANQRSSLPDSSVQLVVTSPPFLNVVQYEIDNWLRCWFIGLDAAKLGLTTPSKLPEWVEIMTNTLRELHRVVKPGGYVAFEVGEVQGGFALDEVIAPAGVEVGFELELIFINAQEFTKTSNCWGVENQALGTNTNRIVVLRKPLN
jgi:hypothetical protein